MVAVTTCVERLAEDPEPTVSVTVITSVLGAPVTYAVLVAAGPWRVVVTRVDELPVPTG